MPRVLLTAFEPFDVWRTNSSWLTLVELTKNLPQHPQITTRLYPVDYEQLRQRLPQDLAHGYDVVIHLGQAAGHQCIHLEMVALNLALFPDTYPDQCEPLVPSGPLAYRSQLPVSGWSSAIRQAGIPAQVSYHAGTYLCNAAFYLTQHFAESHQLPTQALLLHLPLDTSQVVNSSGTLASLPAATCAHAVRIILQQVAKASVCS